HRGRRAALPRVICFQPPTGPAQTSGGCVKEWRTRAQVFRSCARDRPNAPPSAAMVWGSVQSVRTLLRDGAMVATALAPSAWAVNRMSPDGSQANQLADAFKPGVTLFGWPPWAGIVKISPPTTPSSLIRPAINAMELPSGDQRGKAIWRGGFHTCFMVALARSSV